MALGPDLARLQAFQQELLAAPLVPEYSFVSLTELSEYTSTEDDERARLEREEGLAGPSCRRTARSVERADGALPREPLAPAAAGQALLGFYPMSKRRDGADNWYELPFEERKELMGGHARVGRTYAGRVLQLITGSTGLDDWEWGVTLLADDPVALEGHRARDALRSGVGPLRRVRPVLHRAWCSRRPSACARWVEMLSGDDTIRTRSRLFVSFPESLVDRPLIYEIVKRFDVVPNIRRANVEDHSGWIILELAGAHDACDARHRLPRRPRLHGQPHGRRCPRRLSAAADGRATRGDAWRMPPTSRGFDCMRRGRRPAADGGGRARRSSPASSGCAAAWVVGA